eukprot:2988231-Alexandrium_andersonii.AAC.1
MPRWLIRRLWARVSERAVRYARGGELGPLRAVARSSVLVPHGARPAAPLGGPPARVGEGPPRPRGGP